MHTLSGIILAAGSGTRFLPLTRHTPKPLVKIAGRPAITYNMEAMVPHVNEYIIVISHLKEQFPRELGTSYRGIPIKYVEQKEGKGTSAAFASTAGHVNNDSFFLIYGDDLYHPSFFRSIGHKHNAAIGQMEKNWQSFGIFKLKEGRYVESIVEKPVEFIGNLANIGVFHLHKDIYGLIDQVPKSVRGEHELTDLINLYVRKTPVEVLQFEKGWTPLSYPWHILDATEYILHQEKNDIQGTIEKGATIHGTLVLGKNAVIKAGSYLEGNFIIGPNTIIGPNCSLRTFAAIGSGCVLGNGTEITASVLGDYVMAKHLVYVGSSVIGNHVNLAGGTLVANLRHDGQNIKMMVNGKLVDTGRQKFGTIIGDHAKTGIHTSIYPGRKIDDSVWTAPGEIVKADKTRSSL